MTRLSPIALPNSTYALTKRLFDAAKKSILIGIYDFSAPYMKELLLNALQRGVKIKLMLDIDSKDEQQLFNELIDLGVDGVPAPSCASHRIHFFSSSHVKVMIIDGEWALVQSGNYSENGIPLNVVDGGDPLISQRQPRCRACDPFAQACQVLCRYPRKRHRTRTRWPARQ